MGKWVKAFREIHGLPPGLKGIWEGTRLELLNAVREWAKTLRKSERPRDMTKAQEQVLEATIYEWNTSMLTSLGYGFTKQMARARSRSWRGRSGASVWWRAT